MFAKPSAEEDSPSAVTPCVQPRMPWRVVEAQALPGYKLRVRFMDGLAGLVDLSALVQSPRAGVFAPLADPVRFAQASVQHGAVTWPGELDLAPDAMYTAIKKDGEWVLQ